MSLILDDLVSAFRELGLKQGSTVLVHSSMKSFGHVEGGADTVIESLLRAVGPEGSVIVPTLTGTRADSPEHPPVFDVRSTPCWTGLIPETFRKRSDAKRSLHPTHSVCAIGGRRDWFLEGHENSASPCDERSPYYRNAEAGGFVMLVGVTQRSNTTMHCCEELAKVDYHLQKELTEVLVTGYDGQKVLVRNRLHDWNKPPTDFDKFDKLYEEQGIMRIGTAGNSVVRLVDAEKMIDFTVATLRRDPRFLVV